MTTFDTARNAALDHIDRTERKFKLAFFGGVLVEVGFLVAFLLLADLRDRNHLLLLISSVAVYTIIILGLFALGAFMKKNILLVLHGLETLKGK